MAASSQGKIHQIELENFKSYKGHQIIGPFHDFTAIIDPNGSGNSNLMDAISFVLGVRTGHLRGAQLKDLIYAFDDREKEQRGRRAYVKLVYRLTDGTDLLFTRAITSAGGSEYRIDERVVNFEEYSNKLKTLEILVKARNFLVFQGDVESVASKNSKELTVLLEQISGSDEDKRAYEELEEKKGAAEEKSTLAYQKKRTIVQEKKQKKEQKEETEKHMHLQEELRLKKKEHFLWQLFNIENDVEKANEEIENEQKSLQEIISELDGYENESRIKEKEQAKFRKEIEKREKKIAEKKNKIDKNQPELLKLKEEKTRLNAKLKNTGKELDKRKVEKKKHMVEIEKLRNDLEDLTKQLENLQTKGQSEGGKLHLADDQLEAYNRIKEEAGMKTAKLQDEKEVQDREQHADVEAQKNLEENLQQLESRKQELESQQKQMQSRLEKIVEGHEKKRDMGARIAKLESSQEELKNALVEVDEREKELKSTIEKATEEIDTMKEEVQEWKLQSEACEKEMKEWKIKISAATTNITKHKNRIDAKENLITQLNSKEQDILEKCELEQINFPTVADPMDVDSAPGPVYDFSELSRSLQNNMRPAEREKVEADFKQKIGSLISEIDRTAPNLKALDQYAESVASKNSKELTVLLEQISGSDEDKRAYEELEEKKGAAEEKSTLAYQKKRTIVQEKNQKKEQKEETEKHMRLQEELRLKKKEHFLWQLFNIENDVEKANEEIENEQKSLQEIISELDGYENESRIKEKEQAKFRKEIEKREKKIAEKKNKIDKNQPELLKLKEEKTRLNAKLKNTGKELDKRKVEKKKHMVEIEKLRNDLEDLTKQLENLQTKGQSEGGKLHLADDQLEAYNRIKEEAGMKTAKLQDEKEVQDREQHADVEAQKNLEENLQQLESRKQELESQQKQMQSRLEKIVEGHEKKRDMGARIAKLESSQEELKNALVEVDEREKELKSTIEKATEEIDTMKEEVQEWKLQSEACEKEMKEWKIKISAATTNITKHKNRIDAKENLITQLNSKEQDILEKCELEQINFPTVADPMDVDSAPGPVYDFSELSRSLQNNMRPAEREKVEADFKQKIGSLISEIDRIAPNLKALDQYAALQEKEREASKEFEDARDEEKQIRERFETVRTRRRRIGEGTKVRRRVAIKNMKKDYYKFAPLKRIHIDKAIHLHYYLDGVEGHEPTVFNDFVETLVSVMEADSDSWVRVFFETGDPRPVSVLIRSLNAYLHGVHTGYKLFELGWRHKRRRFFHNCRLTDYREEYSQLLGCRKRTEERKKGETYVQGLKLGPRQFLRDILKIEKNRWKPKKWKHAIGRIGFTLCESARLIPIRQPLAAAFEDGVDIRARGNYNYLAELPLMWSYPIKATALKDLINQPHWMDFHSQVFTKKNWKTLFENDATLANTAMGFCTPRTKAKQQEMISSSDDADTSFNAPKHANRLESVLVQVPYFMYDTNDDDEKEIGNCA